MLSIQNIAIESEFDIITKARGRNYYRNRSVSIDSLSQRLVKGTVAGSFIYRVNFHAISPLTVEASCSCPVFAKNVFCKHIYAMALAIEQQADSPFSFNSFERLMLGECEDLALLSTYQESRIPVDERQHQATSVAQQEASHEWEYWMGRIHSRQSLYESEQEERQMQAPRRIWYVLEHEQSVSRNYSVISVRGQELKKDGWGKLISLNVNTDKRYEYNLSEQDAQCLQRLQAFAANDPNDADRFLAYYQDTGKYAYLFDPTTELSTLKMLARTGRLVYRQQQAVNHRSLMDQALQWDQREQWQLQLELRLNSEDNSWHLSGRLQSQEKRLNLKDIDLQLESGLIIYQNAFGRFDSMHSSWLQALSENDGTFIIPKDDQARFLSRLTSISSLPPIEFDPQLEWQKAEILPTPILTFHSAKLSSEELPFSVKFRYGDSEITAHSKKSQSFLMHEKRIVIRDRQFEREALASLQNWATAFSESVWRIPSSSILDMTTALDQENWEIHAEKLRLKPAQSWSSSISSGVDWFELDVELSFDGSSIPIPDLIHAVRNQQDTIRLNDGSLGLLPQAWLEKLKPVLDLGVLEADKLRFKSIQGALLDAWLQDKPNIQVDQVFGKLRQKLRDLNGIRPQESRPQFAGQLRDYQKQGLGWLEFLQEYGFGGCLADDMGLGKTVQVLALLDRFFARSQSPADPAIIVVPRSLVCNWINETQRFTRLKVLDFSGPQRKGLYEKMPDHQIIVTTYAIMRSDIERLRTINFSYAILDEAQVIKNPQSLVSKAARLLTAQHRLCLSGTPVENHLGELWSLFDFLNPGFLGQKSLKITQTKGFDVDESLLQTLRRAVRPFILRRTKEQVLKDLPPKVEHVLHCEMGPTEKSKYDELKTFYRLQLDKKIEVEGMERSNFLVLEGLLRLRQAACHQGLIDDNLKKKSSAKIDFLMQQLEDVMAGKHKCLVFSQFTSLLQLIKPKLDKKKWAFEYLDGKTRQREEKIKRFQEDPECRIFLISLKAGGVGLNLTAADYCFLLDPWWNPAAEAQAIDRTHRIGQDKRVFAYRLICRDTVEEKVLDLQKKKRDLASSFLSNDGSILKNLSRSDLDFIFS